MKLFRRTPETVVELDKKQIKKNPTLSPEDKNKAICHGE